MKIKVSIWLRWILMMPVALICAGLSSFIVHFILYKTLSSGSDPIITPYPEFPERLIQPFVSAYITVWITHLIAPKYKFTSALISALFIVLVIIITILLYEEDKFLNLKMNFNYVPSAIIGAFVSLYSVKKVLEVNKSQQKS